MGKVSIAPLSPIVLVIPGNHRIRYLPGPFPQLPGLLANGGAQARTRPKNLKIRRPRIHFHMFSLEFSSSGAEMSFSTLERRDTGRGFASLNRYDIPRIAALHVYLLLRTHDSIRPDVHCTPSMSAARTSASLPTSVPQGLTVHIIPHGVEF